MPFIADPPRPLRLGELGQWFNRSLSSFRYIVWQSILPFRPIPEPFDDPPLPAAEVTEDQLKQCEAYFDRVEASRSDIEEKARGTFSVITFLAPLMASLFVFFITRKLEHTMTCNVAIGFAMLSFAFLLLAFFSIIRAVAVRPRQTLGYLSVVDVEHAQIRPYSRNFRAGGLLYCASYNDALNAHISQFVKGANVLTALAVVALLIASVPSAYLLSGQNDTSKTEIAGLVNVASPALTDLQRNSSAVAQAISDLANGRIAAVEAAVGSLKGEISRVSNDLANLSNNYTRDNRLDAIDKRLQELATVVADLKLAQTHGSSPKPVKPHRSGRRGRPVH